MAKKFNSDFREFIESLNANHVRYLVVGGYAVAFHGHPRYTKDLDIWIESKPENARELVKALKQFGMESLGLVENDFLVDDQVVQLGFAPNRIDILSSVDGVDFSDCYSHRVHIQIDGIEVDFISLSDLKKNKLASGRHQDLADLDSLSSPDV
jgi:predicted nucleotidyltransferase